MPKRMQASAFEDLVAIASRLPWWVSVVLALIAYVVLHAFAVEPVVTSAPMDQVGGMVMHQMIKVLATFGQYLIPLAFLAGAVSSSLGRRKRAGLVQNVSQDRSGLALRDMNWRDFELLVGEVFRMRGFSVTETGGVGADGGLDLKLQKGGEIFLVQCKQWRATKVSVSVVRELYGVMAAKGAAGGFVVTSGVFTTDARDFANGQNIELIDGGELAEMIEKARAGKPTMSIDDVVRATARSSQVATADPSCPRCGSAMVKRIAKQGANAGNVFWGCSGFPKCRGIRHAE